MGSEESDVTGRDFERSKDIIYRERVRSWSFWQVLVDHNHNLLLKGCLRQDKRTKRVILPVSSTILM